MITHKLFITKDQDASDWVIQLTLKGQPDRQYMTMHPQRVYEPGTDENAWLRCELIRAQVAPVLAKPTEPDPNKVPDWVWEHAPDWAQWAAVDESGSLWFYEKKPHRHRHFKSFDPDAGTRAEFCKVISEKCPGPVPDWTKSLTKRPKHLGGVE